MCRYRPLRTARVAHAFAAHGFLFILIVKLRVVLPAACSINMSVSLAQQHRLTEHTSANNNNNFFGLSATWLIDLLFFLSFPPSRISVRETEMEINSFPLRVSLRLTVYGYSDSQLPRTNNWSCSFVILITHVRVSLQASYYKIQRFRVQEESPLGYRPPWFIVRV